MPTKKKKNAAVQADVKVAHAYPHRQVRVHIYIHIMCKHLQNEADTNDAAAYPTPTWCYVALIAFVLPNANSLGSVTFCTYS